MSNQQKSPQTQWAHEVLKAHFENRSPERIAAPELQSKVACFVSLHNPDDSLRGCIGTIMPTKSTLEEEIKTNALSAAFRDPRFRPLRPEELEGLSISVDVLGEPEAIASLDELNPKIYGVIVAAGDKRGVLLPDLPGVDTVEQQLTIAMQKAGIDQNTPIGAYRFKVERYH